MGFDPARLVRDLALVAGGAAAALALANDLQATAALALVMAAAIAFARRRPDPSVAAAVIAPPPADAAERRRLQTYLDLSPAPLVALRPDGRLRALNRAARRLLGGEEAADPALAGALAASTPRRSGNVTLEIDGRPHGFALVTADLSAGDAAERVAALIDIDAGLKTIEAAAMRDLVQILGHELTNSLTPIASLGRLASDMLTDPATPPADIRDAVDTIARRADGLLAFAEAYRALARLPPPVLRPTPLAPLLDDMVRLFAVRWHGRTLVSDIESVENAVARLDSGQIAQALTALLQNAAEAGTTVSLTAAHAETGFALLVADDGPGIPPAARDEIFRPFFSTKAGGSGIGLALARQIAEAHAGRLDLMPDTGRGVTFRLWLPA